MKNSPPKPSQISKDYSILRKNSLFSKILEKQEEKGDLIEDNRSVFSGEESSVNKTSTIYEESNRSLSPLRNNKLARMNSMFSIKANAGCYSPTSKTNGLVSRREAENDIELTRRATVTGQLHKVTKNESQQVIEMFRTKSKFKNAVRLVTQKSIMMRRESIDFSKNLQSTKILTYTALRNTEMKTISKFTTGYSYVFDMDEELMNMFMSAYKTHNDKLSLHTIVKDLYNLSKASFKKIFTFSKGDYSCIYNDFDNKKVDPVIQRLFDVCKFSNAKMQESLEKFKLPHLEEIRELNDEILQNEIAAEEAIYAADEFISNSLNFIIRNKAQARLSGDTSIDPIFTFSTENQISLVFSGIIQSLDGFVFNAIADAYL